MKKRKNDNIKIEGPLKKANYNYNHKNKYKVWNKNREDVRKVRTYQVTNQQKVSCNISSQFYMEKDIDLCAKSFENLSLYLFIVQLFL